MYCQFCGKPIAEGAMDCPACGRAVPSTAPPVSSPPAGGTASESIESLVAEAKRAAVALAKVSARVSERLIAKAETATQGTGLSARAAARQASKELERARKEIERVLDRLK